MKIGVFDSGLGGLIILKAITERLPEYDYVYFGDTARVPYGDKTFEQIYDFTEQGVTELFKRGCSLVIIACNTASSQALRRLQQVWLPKNFPDRKVLGVVVPTLEIFLEKKLSNIRVLATSATVHSGAYAVELRKRNPSAKIIAKATPELVPIIERGDREAAVKVFSKYLQADFMTGAEALVLGCTHYALVKDIVRSLVPSDVVVISQDEIIPQKLRMYLEAHPEIEGALSKAQNRQFLVTKVTSELEHLAEKWFPGSSDTTRGSFGILEL